MPGALTTRNLLWRSRIHVLEQNVPGNHSAVVCVILSISRCSAGSLKHPLLHKSGELHLHNRTWCQNEVTVEGCMHCC